MKNSRSDSEKRSYTGVVVTSENYKSFSKEERVFHQRHLKAYLSGKVHYHHGFFTNSISMRERILRIVGQEFTKRD